MTITRTYLSFSNNISFESARDSDKMSILEKEVTHSLPLLAQSIISQVESGETRGRMLYKEGKPLGAVIYNRDVTTIKEDREKRTGLCIKNLILFQTAEKQDKDFIIQALVEKVRESAEKLKAENIFIYSAVGDERYKILNKHNFSEIKNQDTTSKELLLLLKLTQVNDKKRKYDDIDNGRSYSDRPQKIVKSHEATLKNVYLNQIKSGQKTIEGRINSGMFLRVQEGDKFRFFSNNDEVNCTITKINKYKSFAEMLQAEGYKKCLPNVSTLEAAVKAYSVIPGYDERASRSGVLALHIVKMDK